MAPATGSAVSKEDVLQYLEKTALPYYQAIMTGQIQVSQQEKTQTEQYIQWAQDFLGTDAGWDPMAGGAGTGVPSNFGPGMAQGPADPNNFIDGPNNNTIATWENVVYNHFSGHPANHKASDVFSNKFTYNNSAYDATVTATPVKHPLTGEDVLQITTKDAFGEKIIYVHNFETTEVIINTPNPANIKIDANAATLMGDKIKTGTFKAANKSAGGATADETLADGTLIYKKADVKLGPIDGGTANIYATNSVGFELDPMDKIASVENSTLPTGEDAIKIVINRHDGKTDTYVIRKSEGLKIILGAITQQLPKDFLDKLDALTKVDGIKDAITITFAGSDKTADKKYINDVAKELGMKPEDIYNNEELYNALTSAEPKLKLEEVKKANIGADVCGLTLEEVLKSNEIMDLIKDKSISDIQKLLTAALLSDTSAKGNLEKIETAATALKNGDFSTDELNKAKDLADKLGLEFNQVLENETLMAITKNKKYDEAFFKNVGNLVDKMGIKGNIEAITAMCDEDVLKWLNKPTATPPDVVLTFLSENDEELASLLEDASLITTDDNKTQAATNARDAVTNRLAELLNSCQDKYDYNANVHSTKDGATWEDNFNYFDDIWIYDKKNGNELGKFDVLNNTTGDLKFAAYGNSTTDN